MTTPLLTSENYASGLLVDSELIGGVAEDKEAPGVFHAFVLRHTTGEYLGYQKDLKLDEALALINAVQRPWAFDSTSQCQGCGKKDQGSCSGMKCSIKRSAKKQDDCNTECATE